MDAQLVGAASGRLKFNQRLGVSRRQHTVGRLGGLAVRVNAEGAGC